jgi:rhodanese-related sulfurtransferase
MALIFTESISYITNITWTITLRCHRLRVWATTSARNTEENTMDLQADASAQNATITAAELGKLLASQNPPRVAEILGASYFEQGHLPGAINLPLEGFVENARRALPDPSAAIVVYCASATCKNSDVAATKLRSLGYTNVRVFTGGKAAWTAEGHLLAAT